MDNKIFQERLSGFYETELWKQEQHQYLIKQLLSQSGLQRTYTPRELCYEIIGKLAEYTNLAGVQICVLFNLEFVDTLVRDYKINPANISYFADSVYEAKAARKWYRVECPNELITWDTDKKKVVMPNIKKQFDVVVMNPPYQSDSGNKGSGNILWDKFVKTANNLAKDNGLISAVHPSLWRKPNHELRDDMLKNNTLEYLEIHDDKDGKKTFGANTRYDWYVSRKGKKNGKTIVKGQDGVQVEVDLRHFPFIPNCDFDLVRSLVAKDGEQKVEILNSQSAYEPRKDWMANEKSAKFKYPCVYMVTKDGPSFKWSNRNDKGHFGIPKVIYGSGEGCMGNFLVDSDGDYGMTQWASGIVDEKDNLEKIADALRNPSFKKLCYSISMSKAEINTSVLRTFRKDFWKEFV